MVMINPRGSRKWMLGPEGKLLQLFCAYVNGIKKHDTVLTQKVFVGLIKESCFRIV